MSICNIGGESILGVSKEQAAAFVYVYNRHRSFDYDNAIDFLDFTKDYLSHIKRK